MSVIIENRNRGHAIKQLQRGLKAVRQSDEYDAETIHDIIAKSTEINVGNVQTQGAIVNALIYVGDELSSLKKLLNEGVVDEDIHLDKDDIPF